MSQLSQNTLGEFLPPTITLEIAAVLAVVCTIAELNRLSGHYVLGLSWRALLLGKHPKISDAVGRWTLALAFLTNLVMNVLIFIVIPLGPYYLIEGVINLFGYRLLTEVRAIEFAALVYLVARSAKVELDRRLAARLPTREEQRDYQALLGGWFREWHTLPKPVPATSMRASSLQGMAKTIDVVWRTIEASVTRPLLRIWAAIYDYVFSELILSEFRKAQPYALTAGAETLLELATTRRVLTALGSTEVSIRMNGQVGVLATRSAVYIAEALLTAYKGFEDARRFVLSYRQGQTELRSSLRIPVDCWASFHVAMNGCVDHPTRPQCEHVMSVALLDESPYGLGLKLDGDGRRAVFQGAATIHLDRYGTRIPGTFVPRQVGTNAGISFKDPIPEPCLAAHHPTWCTDGTLDWTRQLQ